MNYVSRGNLALAWIIAVTYQYGCSKRSHIISEAWPYRDARVVEEEIPEFDPEAVKLIDSRTVSVAGYIEEKLGRRLALTFEERMALESDIAEQTDIYRAVMPRDAAMDVDEYIRRKGASYVRGLLCNVGRARHCLSVFYADMSLFSKDLEGMKAVMKPFKVAAMKALILATYEEKRLSQHNGMLEQVIDLGL